MLQCQGYIYVQIGDLLLHLPSCNFVSVCVLMHVCTHVCLGDVGTCLLMCAFPLCIFVYLQCMIPFSQTLLMPARDLSLSGWLNFVMHIKIREERRGSDRQEARTQKTGKKRCRRQQWRLKSDMKYHQETLQGNCSVCVQVRIRLSARNSSHM